MAEDCGDLLLKNRVGEADNIYYEIEGFEVRSGVWVPTGVDSPSLFKRDHAEKLLWCLTVWAVVINSADARFKMKKFFWQKVKRLGFHQNFLKSFNVDFKVESEIRVPDFTSAMELTYYIRALNMWYFYPILMILDICLFRKWLADDTAKRNIILANLKYSTPFSLLAKKMLNKKESLKGESNGKEIVDSQKV